ncbi:YafY family protein [Marivirga harenae]|uniref:helix-turn-helix transcriptional regulator n=1 Tax=Marivirga harenae TaxID=2010992 RepID=UPI0026E01942|nr:YafY family protein [Marivirga harenae]WKV13595.1 YafY family protein [Marivirga harenae]
MSREKPRLARLTAILTQLQSKRIVTATDIAVKHHVSIRTVYRDIRTLEQSGIPIVTEEGKGYSLIDGYRLPPVMFTEEEANALIMAEHLILRNKDQSLVEQYQNAISKIKSVLKRPQKAKTEVLTERIQIRNNRTNEKTSNFLIQLQSNIINYEIVQLHYISLNNQQTQRKIEPFALYTTKNNWVLIAFCHIRNDFRAFRLDRIQQLTKTQAHFEPHKITLDQYFDNCRKKCESTPDIPLSQTQSTFASNQKE